MKKGPVDSTSPFYFFSKDLRWGKVSLAIPASELAVSLVDEFGVGFRVIVSNAIGIGAASDALDDSGSFHLYLLKPPIPDAVESYLRG